jgi:hypothetical protein
MPEVIDEWRAIDKWWTAEPVERRFVVVRWDGREITFIRVLPEKVWRIIRHRS